MIAYRCRTLLGIVRVELPCDHVMQTGKLALTGSPEAVSWLERCLAESYGLDGVLLRSECRPVDLARALDSERVRELATVELVEGHDVLEQPVPPLPSGSVA